VLGEKTLDEMRKMKDDAAEENSNERIRGFTLANMLYL
jgi:hypothetical protein